MSNKVQRKNPNSTKFNKNFHYIKIKIKPALVSHTMAVSKNKKRLKVLFTVFQPNPLNLSKKFFLIILQNNLNLVRINNKSLKFSKISSILMLVIKE